MYIDAQVLHALSDTFTVLQCAGTYCAKSLLECSSAYFIISRDLDGTDVSEYKKNILSAAESAVREEENQST